MATYKEKVGTSVVNYAGNYPGAVDGELWYDSTNKDFKYQYPNVTAAGSWRTQANMNTAREVNGAGTVYTAALAFGMGSAVTELWGGSSWTTVNSLNTSKSHSAGFGASCPCSR